MIEDDTEVTEVDPSTVATAHTITPTVQTVYEVFVLRHTSIGNPGHMWGTVIDDGVTAMHPTEEAAKQAGLQAIADHVCKGFIIQREFHAQAPLRRLLNEAAAGIRAELNAAPNPNLYRAGR